MKTFMILISTLVLSYGQKQEIQEIKLIRNDLTERIGNFSIELLNYMTKEIPADQNLIAAPVSAWTVIAVIGEGAFGNTLVQINKALRMTWNNRVQIRSQFTSIANWLNVNTSTIELHRIGALFVDQGKLPLPDFQQIAQDYYFTKVVPLNFTQGEVSAKIINTAISNFTHGKISHLVDPSYFADAQMFLTSAVYFKGQWATPFNSSSTSKASFFSSAGKKIGEVNMMYNRHTYPFTNIKQLQARVIELPYGQEDRLSMLIMMPNPGVSLEDMFLNFNNVPLDIVFKELKVAREEFGDDEVDCFIPRFKIDSSLDLTEIFKKQFGMEDLFDSHRAELPYLARWPLYVSRIFHKAEIEVTEDGTVAAGVTTAEFSNRIGVIRFEVNRPFTYLIVEKITNTIVFGGLYRQPSLY